MPAIGWSVRPPAHSPLSAGALIRASFGGLTGPSGEERLASFLRKRYGVDEVVLCASGTQALTRAIEVAAGRKRGGVGGGTTALPAYSCYDLVTAAVGAGAAMSFYDLEPERLAPLEEEVVRVLQGGASSLVVSPLFGFPVDWDRLQGIVREAGALLIEDAAQGAGAGWKGRPLGSHGELAVLSFGRGKGWTGGGGGALLARGESAEVLRTFPPPPAPARRAGVRAAGLSWVQWGFGRPSLYGIPARMPGLGLGETRYRTPEPVVGIARFSARLAVATAEAALGEGAFRRERAEELASTLCRGSSSSGVTAIRSIPGGEPGFLRFPVLVRGGRRDSIPAHLARRAGVSTGYPAILPDLPRLIPELRAIADRFLDVERDYPGARRLVEELLTLPDHRFASPRVAEELLEWVG